jgi:hypothetical protein
MTRHDTTIKCDFLSFPQFSFRFPSLLFAVSLICGPPQPSNQWVPAFYTGSKAARRRANQSLSSSADVMNEWSYTSTPHTCLQGMDREGFTFIFYNNIIGGTRWHSWLRHCYTSRKVAGSIPDGVIILPAALCPWG